MQIDFKALEQALAPIAEIGQGELTFDAGSTTITIRVLLPSEEVEAQKYAAGALNESDQGEHSAVDYLDRFRIGCLSHAVIAVGETSFRGVEYVETGEKLDTGVPIKIQKYKAMRQLLSRWSRAALTAVFAKFNDLVTKTEAEAEKQIEYEPSSIPAEIERLQKRMEDLQAQLEQSKAAEQAKFSDKVAALAKADDQEPEAPPQPEVDPDEPVINPEQALPAAARRTGPISPSSAPPPPERQPRPARPAPAQTRPATPPADSSFINMDDDDNLDAALDAEHNRLLEMRRRSAAGQQPVDQGSALQGVHPQVRRAPHLDAREAEEEVGALAASAKATQRGEIDGAPVFEMPVQDLGTPAARTPSAAPVLNPPKEASGSRNPRFKSPPKP